MDAESVKVSRPARPQLRPTGSRLLLPVQHLRDHQQGKTQGKSVASVCRSFIVGINALSGPLHSNVDTLNSTVTPPLTCSRRRYTILQLARPGDFLRVRPWRFVAASALSAGQPPVHSDPKVRHTPRRHQRDWRQFGAFKGL